MISHDLDELVERIKAAPAMPGLVIQGPLDLSQRIKPPISSALTQPVSEGGGEDRNRWSEFNRVAGHHIHLARSGMQSLEEGYHLTHGWMMVNMVPPWPDQRFESEFKGLYESDLKNHGPFPTIVAPKVQIVNGQGAIPVVDMTGRALNILDWAVHKWSGGQKPLRRWLVHRLIQQEKSSLLVASGGVGKTFSILDLGLKISGAEPKPDPDKREYWMGQPIMAGGDVVIITGEDDAEELHIRLADLDPFNRRMTGEGAGQLIIVPLPNVGGSMRLMQYGIDKRAYPTPEWQSILNQMAELPNLKFVAIDTMNATIHGEENSALVISEYYEALKPVMNEMKAAIMVTHHVRKGQIGSLEALSDAVRGSSAIINSFRAVMGIYHPADFEKRLDAMGEKVRPGWLYNFGVLKANNPEMMREEKTLLRERSGALRDVTALDTVAKAKKARVSYGDAKRWVVVAVKLAAEAGYPFTGSGASGVGGKRSGELPPAVMEAVTGEKRRQDLCKELVAEGRLRTCAPKGSKIVSWLDVPGGELAQRGNEEYEFATGSWDRPDWSKMDLSQAEAFARLSGLPDNADNADNG